MRAPRRRTLRRGGRRAEAPFQGASAALSMATLAGAACVGRHELPCRHTAREFFSFPSFELLSVLGGPGAQAVRDRCRGRHGVVGVFLWHGQRVSSPGGSPRHSEPWG